MLFKLSARVQNLKPSPTLALAAKAKELKAEGHDVISLSVGEPDWDTFPSIKKVAIEALDAGLTKYAPSNGIPELREAICKQTNSDLGTDYAANQVTVSTGGKFVIFSALQSLIEKGDEVIVPTPYWVSYPTMVGLAEGTPVIANCDESSNFKLSAQGLQAAVTDKTKLLILNSPSNPTGFMYTREELQALAEVLRKHPQVMVMSDDIYNRLVFDPIGLAPHLLQVAPDLVDRVVIINGASKTYSMTGWRVGWAVGPLPLIQAMTRYQSQSVSCASPFAQKAAVQAITGAGEELAASLVQLKKRCDKVYANLSKVEGIKVAFPDGAFYIWPDVSAHFGKSWKGKTISSSSEFSAALLESQMVVAVPGNEFGLEGYLRLSYALSEERMAEAVQRLTQFISELD